MVAIAPRRLVQSYIERDLVGGVFSLYHFQIEPSWWDFPRHHGYSFIRDEQVIAISRNTMLIPLPSAIAARSPVYPLVSAIRWLLHERSTRRMMIGKLNNLQCFIY